MPGRRRGRLDWRETRCFTDGTIEPASVRGSTVRVTGCTKRRMRTPRDATARLPADHVGYRPGVGTNDGAPVGEAVGAAVGEEVGAAVGAEVGAATGLDAANTKSGRLTAITIGATHAAAFTASRLLRLNSCSAAFASRSRSRARWRNASSSASIALIFARASCNALSAFALSPVALEGVPRFAPMPDFRLLKTPPNQ